jgi:phenylpyruvate tautomerase PptA (4-oxalocrotonate tautomerase family)
MPYLQLDVPHQYPADVRRRLVVCFGDLFARIMQTTPDRVVVAFRELAEGALLRCGDGNPQPAAVLKCDIRRGRSADQTAELARALIGACIETLGLHTDQLSVEFTQHAGDEIFEPSGDPAGEWTPAEARDAPRPHRFMGPASQ